MTADLPQTDCGVGSYASLKYSKTRYQSQTVSSEQRFVTSLTEHNNNSYVKMFNASEIQYL